MDRTSDEERQMLDFTRYAEWQSKFPESIKLPGAKTGPELVEGDQLHTEFKQASTQPIVVCNTSQEFRWSANAGYGAWAAIHYWNFTESKTIPGGTLLLHGDEYIGWGKVMFRQGWPLYQIGKSRFEEYNKELKARVEALKAAGEFVKK